MSRAGGFDAKSELFVAISGGYHPLSDNTIAIECMKKWCETNTILNGVPSSLLFLIAHIVTTSKALVTRSDALVPSSLLNGPVKGGP